MTTTITVTEEKQKSDAENDKLNEQLDAQSREESSSLLRKSREKHDKSEKSEEQPRDEGKFASKEADEKPEKQAESSKPKIPAEKQESYEKAMTALLKDGTFSQEELATMPPDVIITKGEKAQKRQSDVDRGYKEGKNASAELETLKAKLAELEKAAANPKGTAAKSGQTAQQLASVQTLSKKFKEYVGDASLDPTPELAALFEDFVAASKPDLSEHDRKFQDLEGQYKNLAGQYEKIVASGVRPSLTKQFPELKEDAAWSKNIEKGRKLVDAGIVDNLEDGLKSAAGMDYGLSAAERESEREKAIDKAKENGQPHSGKARSEDTKAGNPEDEQRAYLQRRRREIAAES